jgi:acyl-CoA dehydrogenase
MSELEAFRTEIRAWIEANCPPEMKTPIKSDDDTCWGGRNFKFSRARRKSSGWNDGRERLTVPDWPKAYGGAGLSACRNEDFPSGDGASWVVSPLNLASASGCSARAPQVRHRRAEAPLFAADRARRNPLVSGLFGTGARVRTLFRSRPLAKTREIIGSSTARKSGPAMPTRLTGSSVLSAPTRPTSIRVSASCCSTWTTPGVSTKPILLISGNSPFCETFFDNVVVPKHQIVGELNRGWDVAKYLLGHEREMISGGGLGEGLASLGAAFPDAAANEPILRAEMAMFDVETIAFRAHSNASWTNGRLVGRILPIPIS